MPRLRYWLLLGACCALGALREQCAHAAPPKVNYFFPAGSQRGQTIDGTAGGEFPAWPVNVWADRPGITVTALEEKGKLRVATAADAPPGVTWLRIHDGAGAAPMRAWIVGQLPEAAETEPNNTPAEASAVPLPVTINGKLGQAGDVDGFIVELKSGQTLVASVTANSLLGAALDGVLQVCQIVERPAAVGSPKRVEAFVIEQNHDAVGVDPQLVFVAPKDGRYLVRLMAFSEPGGASFAYAGGDALVYRLTFTVTGYVDHALPLALAADGKREVRLFGWGLDPAGVAVQALAEQPDRRLAHAFLPGIAGDATIARVTLPTVLAAPDARPAKPQPVDMPIVVSGRLSQAKQVDAFRFRATKDEKFVFRVEARSLGSPLDAVLVVTNSDGQMLVRGDDFENQRDPTLLFAAPADGDYAVEVRDLHNRGGLRYVYRLFMTRQEPDFALTLAEDAFVLTRGKPLEIPIAVDRRFGFGEAISIRAVGLPAGIDAPTVVSEAKGDSAKAVKLILTAAADASLPVGVPFRIEGQATGLAPRSAFFPLKQPLAGQHVAAWLTITASEAK